MILSSEAAKQAAINNANGEAQAITARAQATAAGIRMLAAELMSNGGTSAAQLRVAEQYVEVGGLGSGVCVVGLVSSTPDQVYASSAPSWQLCRTLLCCGGGGTAASLAVLAQAEQFVFSLNTAVVA